MTRFIQHVLFVVWGVIGFLIFDALGFFLWVFSGQYPAEDAHYYVGMITKTVLAAIQ